MNSLNSFRRTLCFKTRSGKKGNGKPPVQNSTLRIILSIKNDVIPNAKTGKGPGNEVVLVCIYRIQAQPSADVEKGFKNAPNTRLHFSHVQVHRMLGLVTDGFDTCEDAKPFIKSLYYNTNSKSDAGLASWLRKLLDTESRSIHHKS